MQRLKALKRGAKREKREAAARDALKEAQAAMPTSPRQAANRLRGEPGGTPTRTWQVRCESAACSRLRHLPKVRDPAVMSMCLLFHQANRPVSALYIPRCLDKAASLCPAVEPAPWGSVQDMFSFDCVKGAFRTVDS